MRIACLVPGLIEVVCDLGLGEQVVARVRGGVVPAAAAHAAVVGEYHLIPAEQPAARALMQRDTLHNHRSRVVVDWEALEACEPDVVIVEETCATCREAYRWGSEAGIAGTGDAALGGRRVRVFAAGVERVADSLAVIEPLAAAVGVPERGVALRKVREARLLALRMHVARYVVRTGAAQRLVAAAVDDVTFAARRDLLHEMIDAAGGVSPSVVTFSSAPGGALPVAPPPNVMLVGEHKRRLSEVAGVTGRRIFEQLSAAGGAVAETWAFDVDRLLAYPGPGLVRAVESLLRIITPEALGANGTPPPADQALRVGGG